MCFTLTVIRVHSLLSDRYIMSVYIIDTTTTTTTITNHNYTIINYNNGNSNGISLVKVTG